MKSLSYTPFMTTQTQLAKQIGVTQAWISIRSKRKGAPKLDDVKGWKLLLAAEGRATSAPKDLQVVIATERAGILAEQHKLLELERREKEKELIPMESAREVLRGILGPIRQKFLALGLEMSARTNPSDPEFARIALEAWTDEAMKLCREKF